MRDYLEILAFVTIGIFLLWFGYTLYFKIYLKLNPKRKRRQRQFNDREMASPGDPQTCPLCSSKLDGRDLVKTMAFPSITGGRDRLMYIKGCVYCLNRNLPRHCPVCGASLNVEEILVARLFERPLRRPHVHVQGCTKCRKVASPG